MSIVTTHFLVSGGRSAKHSKGRQPSAAAGSAAAAAGSAAGTGPAALSQAQVSEQEYCALKAKAEQFDAMRLALRTGPIHSSAAFEEVLTNYAKVQKGKKIS